MKKILVTGGTGYIGSHTMIDLILHGYEPVSVDNGINSDVSILKNIENITGVCIKHYNFDVCNRSLLNAIFNENKFDGIIHFAALKSVSDSVNDPLRYFRNNIDSLLNVLEAAKVHHVGAFIFSSSCTVYGDVTESPVNELTPLKEAASPYGRSKQIGEQIIMDTLKEGKTRASLLRYFNPAGAHTSGLIGESPSQTAQNLIPVITETAIGKRENLWVFGDDYPTRDGSCIRDYIHVMDLARAHTLALDHILCNQQSTQVEVFNLGMGKGVSVLEAIRAFERVSGVKLNFKTAPRRDGDVMAIYSDYQKAKNLLNWEPMFGIDDIMSTAWVWELKRNQK